jgi:hypothetical protein
MQGVIHPWQKIHDISSLIDLTYIKTSRNSSQTTLTICIILVAMVFKYGALLFYQKMFNKFIKVRLYIFQNTLLSMRDVFQEYKTLILVFVSQYWLFSFNQLLQCIQHSNVNHYFKIFKGPPFS